MKRALLTGAGAALVMALLSGFSLFGLTAQTPRLRWNTISVGSSITPGHSLSGTFTASTSVAGGVQFGPAVWRMGGIECAFGVAGATDGGTNAMTVRVVHEDGGEDCVCGLGNTSCTAINTSLSCDCPNGITELAGSAWNVQPGIDAGCAALPGSMFCTVDLFR